MKISQSLIKDVKKYQCSEFIKLRYEEGVKYEVSNALEDGLYFESELIGSARGGKFKLPVKYKCLKPKSNEKKEVKVDYIFKKDNSVPKDILNKFTSKKLSEIINLLPIDEEVIITKRQQDVDKVIERAKIVLEKANIVVQEVQVYKEVGNSSGHIDFIGTINGNKAIFDVKFTGLALSRWESEMKYGGTAESFEIQSSHYMKLYEEEKLDFYFLVFSSAGWDKFYLKPFSSEAMEEATDRINETTLDLLGSMKADSNTCNICPLNDVCKVREFVPKIELL